jgi:hypothetical protein
MVEVRQMNFELPKLIRLNARGISYVVKCGGKHPGGNHAQAIDWKNRTGKLVRVTRDQRLAYIVWDGNKGISDPLPINFIEPLTMT